MREGSGAGGAKGSRSAWCRPLLGAERYRRSLMPGCRGSSELPRPGLRADVSWAFGSAVPRFASAVLLALCSFGCRGFRAEVSEPFGDSGAEALEPGYRRLRRGRGCCALHGATVCRVPPGFDGSRVLWNPRPEGSGRAVSRGSNGRFREGSKARAGPRSRRRDGESLGRQDAGGGASG
jgi:hypothetical protein